jgi:hypothetical protein
MWWRFVSGDVTTVTAPGEGDLGVMHLPGVADEPLQDTASCLVSRRPCVDPLAWVTPNRNKWPVVALDSADLGPRTHTPLSECGGHP